MKETYTKLLNEFIEIYSSEPNKLIDHQLGELTCTISEDFCNQFTNYCSEKGVDTELARKIVKIIKSSKLKVQAAIQGDQVRLTGKKRDDLQQTIAALKEEKFGIPLHYINFRD